MTYKHASIFLVFLLLFIGCAEKKEIIYPPDTPKTPTIAPLSPEIKPERKNVFDYFTKENIDAIKIGLQPHQLKELFGEPTFVKTEEGKSLHSNERLKMEQWVYGGMDCLNPNVNCFIFGKKSDSEKPLMLGSWKINKVANR